MQSNVIPTMAGANVAIHFQKINSFIGGIFPAAKIVEL
jgi:hypothetical protein